MNGLHKRLNKGLFFLALMVGCLAAVFVYAQDGKDPSDEKYVSIDLNDVDIRVFIKFISELTGENFIVDSKVKGNVNIISPGKITVEEAYKVFESVLEVHGFTAVKSGEISKIIPTPLATAKNVETRISRGTGSSEDKIVTQLIPLNYADVEEVKKLFTPLVSKGSVILAYAPTNTLIITDMYSNIKRLLKIFDALDVKDVGRQISVIPLEFASASDLEKKLNTLFQAKLPKGKNVTSDEVTKFVSDERTNSIIILANTIEAEAARELIKSLDKAVPRSDAKIHVYYLENANAEELATVLQSLSGKTAQADQDGKQLAPVVSEKVKITADKATNSLILMADMEDYKVLEGIIKKLDIPRPMVYIEALIMEVRDTDSFELGVEWTAATSAGEIDSNRAGIYTGYNRPSSTTGIGAIPTISNGAMTLPGGFSMGIMSEAIQIGGISFPSLSAAIKALKTNEQVQIISTPQIMTTDNEEAEISVGENVPYLTTSGTGDQNYENFEYKDVGVTLKITPQISQERFVRLDIYQKVEKLSSTSADTTPTTLKRTAETTVVVKDAATVVIGGLIGEDMTSRDYKTPCLGDLPLAGNLFKSNSKQGVQTNLYIFLTPHIIENPQEANDVYEDKSESIRKIKEKIIPLPKESRDEN